MIQLMRKRIDPDALEVLYDRPFSKESFEAIKKHANQYK